MILYLTPTCPMVAPVRTYLDGRGVAYTFVDVEQNAQAAAHLRQLTGGFLSVPTLIDDAGRVLVEPSLSELAAWLTPPRATLPILPMLTGALGLGAAAFLTGVQVGQDLTLSAAAMLMLVVGTLALSLVMWLPPLARLMQRLRHGMGGAALMLVFCGAIGLLLAATSRVTTEQVLPLILSVVVGITVGVALAMRLPARWRLGWLRLERGRKGLSLVALGLFVAALFYSVLTQDGSGLRVASLGLLVVMSLTLLTSIVQAARPAAPWRESASTLLGTMLGVVMVAAFVAGA